MGLYYLTEEDYKTTPKSELVSSQNYPTDQLTHENINFLKSKGFKVRPRGGKK